MYCECGCGQITKIATQSNTQRGWVRGQHKRFINGHNSSLRRGAKHPNWSGGKSIGDGGYIRVHIPRYGGGKNTHSYILEHRLVMQEHLGRELLANETVHHLNGDRQDNRLENLQLLSYNHPTGQAWECSDCGSHNIKPIVLDDNV